jgi:hypothetical protein
MLQDWKAHLNEFSQEERFCLAVIAFAVVIGLGALTFAVVLAPY